MDINLHFVFAFVIRLALIAYGYFQDAFFDVKYTDVDYQVFTDASQYVSAGLSPFRRQTYRYTPILAFMLLPNVIINDAFGKLMFSLFDVLTSAVIYRIQNVLGFSIELCRMSTFMWLYNPLPIVISTRGNAESIMTFLVALSVLFYLMDYTFLFSVVYGLAVHFKVYPCIYAISFYFALSSHTIPFSGCRQLKNLLHPSRKKVVFVLSSAFGFFLPTVISLVLYKDEYLQEALLYHVTRKDIRHNFSPYFYILYLSEAFDQRLANILSVMAFFLQAILITLVSWVFASTPLLPACMFIETFLFVSFNKVCTSQYFLWYLCLFSMCIPLMNGRMKHVVLAFLAWICGQTLWLLPAYYLEFRGRNTFMLICTSGLLFFLINVLLIGLFIKHVFHSFYICTAKSKNK